MSQNAEDFVLFYAFTQQIRRVKINSLMTLNQEGISYHFDRQISRNTDSKEEIEREQGRPLITIDKINFDEQIFIPFINDNPSPAIPHKVLYNFKIPILQNWFTEIDYTQEAEVIFENDPDTYTDDAINKLKEQYSIHGYASNTWTDIDTSEKFTNDVRTTNKWIFNPIARKLVVSVWFSDGSELPDNVKQAISKQGISTKVMKVTIGDRNENYKDRILLSQNYGLSEHETQEFVPPTFVYPWDTLCEEVGSLLLPFPEISATDPQAYIQLDYADIPRRSRESEIFEPWEHRFLFFKATSGYTNVTPEYILKNRNDWENLRKYALTLSHEQQKNIIKFQMNVNTRALLSDNNNNVKKKSSSPSSDYDRMSPQEKKEANARAEAAADELLNIQKPKAETPEEKKRRKRREKKARQKVKRQLAAAEALEKRKKQELQKQNNKVNKIIDSHVLNKKEKANDLLDDALSMVPSLTCMSESIFKPFPITIESVIWDFFLSEFNDLFKNIHSLKPIIQGGISTFLHTDGKYPTEDLDIKFYPTPETINSYDYIKQRRRIKKKLDKWIFSEYENKLMILNNLLMNAPESRQVTKILISDNDTKKKNGDAIVKNDDIIKIALEFKSFVVPKGKTIYHRGSSYYPGGKVPDGKITAYCDLGFYKQFDAKFDGQKNLHLIVRKKLQTDNKDFYSFGGFHIPPASWSYKNITTPIPILNKDYLIYEKRELLDDYNNKKGNYNEKIKNNNGDWVMPSVEHKEIPWNQQLELLEEDERKKKLTKGIDAKLFIPDKKKSNKKK